MTSGPNVLGKRPRQSAELNCGNAKHACRRMLDGRRALSFYTMYMAVLHAAAVENFMILLNLIKRNSHIKYQSLLKFMTRISSNNHKKL